MVPRWDWKRFENFADTRSRGQDPVLTGGLVEQKRLQRSFAPVVFMSVNLVSGISSTSIRVLNAITDLGDSAVLSGIILLTASYLLFGGCRRHALILVSAFLATALTIGLLKMFFFSCHSRFTLPSSIHSPSGHAALTTVVWGLLATLIAAQYYGWRRRLTLTVATILIGSIAYTRWLLHFHTRSEIIAGLAVGFVGLLAARFFLNRTTPQKFDPRGLIVATAVAAVVLHGFRLPAEGFMQALAQLLQGSISFCTP